MTDAEKPTTSTIKRRRGVVRASMTRLSTRLKELEAKAGQPSTFDLAQRMSTKLESLDSEFRTHHYALVDLIEEQEAMQREQEILDEHDDEMVTLATRIKHLIAACSPSTGPSPRKIATRRLSRLEKGVASVCDAIRSSTGDRDTCLLRQYEEQLRDFKTELSDVSSSLLSLDLDESDDLCMLQTGLEKKLFDCGLEIKKRLSAPPHTPDSSHGSADGKGVRLPELDAPKFDGNIINWPSFWEQFDVSIHSRSTLSDSEKLAYLRHSLKDGTAKGVIEGLSRSGEYYAEAIESLKARYNRPRLIHQTHVRMILDAPALKDGTGRELRKLHDTVQQHLRALKAMGQEPSGPFITSVLELKLDNSTMFEWQKFSQDSPNVPHYQKLLEFLNLRAQASEASVTDPRKLPRTEDRVKKTVTLGKHVPSFTASTTDPVGSSCTMCKTDKHPLFTCPRFKALPHDKMISILKSNDLCLNCLRPGHFVKQCKSLHRCKRCQKPHHTLLHIDQKEDLHATSPTATSVSNIALNSATRLTSQSLLMTCRVLVRDLDGSSVEARAILDSASSVSFVSERLAQCLHLPRYRRDARILGVAGLSHSSSVQTVTKLIISPKQRQMKEINVTAIIVPQVTRDLPIQHVPFKLEWKHLEDLTLADPDFGHPGRIDILLGVDVFAEVVRQGRRTGAPGSPTAFETDFGWVLAGETSVCASHLSVTSCHISMATGNDLLQRFWEIEEQPREQSGLSPEERSVVQHFEQHHFRKKDGQFIVPLPKRPHAKPLGESRSQAVRRFLSLERSLRLKGMFEDLGAVLQEYFDQNQPVPAKDLKKPTHDVFYLPMHVVQKESSSTTKLRAVFDASALSSTGVSLNDTLLVGPTVHSSLTEVLLRFRLHRIALTTDVSRMYRAVHLDEADKDLHRFVWRRDPSEPLHDYRMTRITFGVSASSYAANMAVKQNAADFALDYPLAARVVNESFYVDDGLTGADSVEEAITLQKQLQELFNRGGFTLRKWNSSNHLALQHVPDELKDFQSLCAIPDSSEYTKTLGIEWNTVRDQFRLNIAKLPPLSNITKRLLVSDVAKTFDILGWFSPCTIMMKILFQQLWELKVDWDDTVPECVRDAWMRWRSELDLLSTKPIPRCYFSKSTHVTSKELHGFCDASEQAYAAVLYLRMLCTDGSIQVALVTSKTKVAPIRKLTIPRLELCGAHILSQLLHHVRQVFGLPLTHTYAWTDSTIVLSWLIGNPKRFKTYVCNRVSNIVELIGPGCWHHVSGMDNPADCASRGLFPSELLDHDLWWSGPNWLRLPSSHWPHQTPLFPKVGSEEEREIALHTLASDRVPVISIDRYSSYSQLKRVTAWITRFIHNCQAKRSSQTTQHCPHLTVLELRAAETYWLSIVQGQHFARELKTLKEDQALHKSSPLISLHPFLDSDGLLRVGGRERNSQSAYSSRHPLILHNGHPVTRLIIRSEHHRLLHAGPTLLACSLNRRFYILGGRKAIRSITRGCVTCRRTTVKPRDQMMGQLPLERITPDLVFNKVGVDYAGPFYLKLGHTRKPTVVKAYACIFVSLSVKAVHLELVSDLTTEAFIACLRRFISRRGKPMLMWSDHGTNFVGASREIKELVEFVETQRTQKAISEFCSAQNIEWRFIPEHAPHFGGLWEAAVKSMKTHLRRVVSNVKLTFEELTTILAQVEACLNSRPLIALPADDDGIEALTPGHFLIGRPLEALPDPPSSCRSISLLSRWHLCQALVRHFWQRWSFEYLNSLKRFTKWHSPSRNMQVGDIVILREDKLVPMKWPLGRVIDVHPGKDGLVRVVTIKTAAGVYKRPVTKVAPLLLTSD